MSIKGIYFQSEVQGLPVTWVIPHQFTQYVPDDVDFRIMMTFLEFYEVLLKFVLYKLYHQMDMSYPPVRTPTPPCSSSVCEAWSAEHVLVSAIGDGLEARQLRLLCRGCQGHATGRPGRQRGRGSAGGTRRGRTSQEQEGAWVVVRSMTSCWVDGSNAPCLSVVQAQKEEEKERKKAMKGLEDKLAQLTAGEGYVSEEEDELPEGVLGESLGKAMEDVMEVSSHRPARPG